MANSIAIIGAGWYGCHVATYLIDNGYLVDIYDGNHIFYGSSSKNQNRLHLGFHYPRSKKTRSLCKNGFDLFKSKYQNCLEKINNNYYYVANESIIDFDTYCGIFSYENIPYKICDNNLLNTQGFICVD